MNTTTLFYSEFHDGYILGLFEDTYFVENDSIRLSFYSMRFEVPYMFRQGRIGQGG